jgi:hypothetical protein
VGVGLCGCNVARVGGCRVLLGGMGHRAVYVVGWCVVLGGVGCSVASFAG